LGRGWYQAWGAVIDVYPKAVLPRVERTLGIVEGFRKGDMRIKPLDDLDDGISPVRSIYVPYHRLVSLAGLEPSIGSVLELDFEDGDVA